MVSPGIALASNHPPDDYIKMFESLPGIKNGEHLMMFCSFWYTGRDSNPQPLEPESNALSIEPPVHLHSQLQYYSKLL